MYWLYIDNHYYNVINNTNRKYKFTEFKQTQKQNKNKEKKTTITKKK